MHHELCQISHAPLHVNEIWEARAGIWLAIIIVFTLQHFTDWISIVFHLSCCNYNCLGTGLHAGRVSNWDSDVTYQSLTFMYTTCWLSSHSVCFFFSIIFFLTPPLIFFCPPPPPINPPPPPEINIYFSSQLHNALVVSGITFVKYKHQPASLSCCVHYL